VAVPFCGAGRLLPPEAMERERLVGVPAEVRPFKAGEARDAACWGSESELLLLLAVSSLSEDMADISSGC